MPLEAGVKEVLGSARSGRFFLYDLVQQDVKHLSIDLVLKQNERVRGGSIFWNKFVFRQPVFIDCCIKVILSSFGLVGLLMPFLTKTNRLGHCSGPLHFDNSIFYTVELFFSISSPSFLPCLSLKSFIDSSIRNRISLYICCWIDLMG